MPDKRKALERDAADAMKAAGRIPEPMLLTALPDDLLREIIAHWGLDGALFVA